MDRGLGRFSPRLLVIFVFGVGHRPFPVREIEGDSPRVHFGATNGVLFADGPEIDCLENENNGH